MAFNGNTLENSSEQLGAFAGYVRRPQPNQHGMIANIFGENGQDADTILALSLTKFQDIQVYVNIYLIKDFNGFLMKKDSSYPLISSFLGFIRRSTPKKDGMIAQIFAPNGIHADSISNLSKSEYQDALVYVDIRGIKSINKQNEIQNENFDTIDEKYQDKITKIEKIEMKKKEKKFKKINSILIDSNFFSKIEVLSCIGKDTDYTKWLIDNKTCAYMQPSSPCHLDSTFVEVKGLMKPFNYLPCCDTHRVLFEASDNFHFLENKFYYEAKHELLLREWAIDTLTQKLLKPNATEPNPLDILEWITNNKLIKLMPVNYKENIFKM